MSVLRFYIKALYLSFFSRRFYLQLFEMKIAGFWYALFLALILTLPYFYLIRAFSERINQGEPDKINHIISDVENQLPHIYVESGKLRTVPDGNSVINYDGREIVLFDMENSVSDISGIEAPVIVKPEKLIIIEKDISGNKMHAISMSELAEGFKNYFVAEGNISKLDTKLLFEHTRALANISIYTIMFMLWLAFMIKVILFSLLYAFLVSMFLSVMLRETNFDLKKCFRIAVFTSTPAIFLEAFSNMTAGGLFAYQSIVYFTAHIVYIHFSVESYRKLSAGRFYS